MTTIPNALVVRTDFPADSVGELIGYAKANPGKVNFGSQGVGSDPTCSIAANGPVWKFAENGANSWFFGSGSR